MKHFVLIAALLLVSTSALADQTMPVEKIVLLKSTTEQHALAEALSARIKSALLGERYTLNQSCTAEECKQTER